MKISASTDEHIGMLFRCLLGCPMSSLNESGCRLRWTLIASGGLMVLPIRDSTTGKSPSHERSYSTSQFRVGDPGECRIELRIRVKH
jgi:hypothetical protein